MRASSPQSVAHLDDLLSTPRAATRAALAQSPGDVIVLGAGGKMGPTLARMARRAAPDSRRVIAVSRFSSPDAAEALQAAGIEVIACDLHDRRAIESLPDAANVVFMAGQKFGTRDAPSRTWMANVVLPAQCAERYADARWVAFSTGNVYPLTPISGRGSRESDPVAPVGEYAASCVGRERVLEAYAARGMPVALVRLNYAIDLRYGVLTDLATKVLAGAPISLAMGRVNVIWQGDANRAALELLPRASSPPLVVNVTGRESLEVRVLATLLGERLGRAPVFDGVEGRDALLSDASLMHEILPPAEADIGTMLDWVADWVQSGRPLLNKPTHFDERSGRF